MSAGANNIIVVEVRQMFSNIWVFTKIYFGSTDLAIEVFNSNLYQ
jgi:hypothetical protein